MCLSGRNPDDYANRIFSQDEPSAVRLSQQRRPTLHQGLLTGATLHFRRLVPARLFLLTLFILVITSCEADKTTAPSGLLTLSIAPASVTVSQGNTAQISATLTRSNYAGAVTFAVNDAPAGVSVDVGLTQTIGNTTTVNISIVAGPNAVPGNYSLEITGEGNGVDAATKTLTLVVIQAGSFGLSVAVAEPLLLKQGMSDSSRTVTIARSNYSEPVTLTAENLPPGTTASFSRTPVSGNSSVLTLTAAIDAQLDGPVTITIRGTGPAAGTNPGLPSVVATTTLQLIVTTAGAFTLTVEPTPSLTIAQGATNNSRTITINRTEFTGPITLQAENLPEGVTATFTPNPATANSSQLTVTAAADATVSDPITITIRGSGPVESNQTAMATIEASTTMQLTVTHAPDFTLLVNPPATTIEQGQSKSDIVVSIVRTEFNDPVTLSLVGDAPAGVTASFSPVAPAGSSSSLTVAVGPAVPPGSYTLTISGTGAPGTRTVPLTLTVAAAPPPTGTYTLSMPAPCAQNFRLRQAALDDRRLVFINRDKMPNPIHFSLQGLPTGVTASFDANPVTGNTVRPTFIASADATPGEYTVMLRGDVPGSDPVTMTFTIDLHEVDPAEDNLDVLSFDFSEGSTGGWRRGIVCPQGNADNGDVTLQEDMVVMGGRGPSSGRTEPNAWMSRLIRLPANASVFRFDASAHHLAFCAGFCRTRVRVRLFEGSVGTILLDETIEWIAQGRVFVPYDADVSPWAGKVVRIMIEQLDPDVPHVQLWLDSFRILGPTN